MPTETISHSVLSPVLTSRYYPPGLAPDTIVWNNRQTKHREKRWNDAEHRPKPQNLSAKSSMTSQSPQFTKVTTGAVFEKVIRKPFPGGYVFETYREEATYLTSPSNYWVPEDLWSLKFREQVESKSVQLSEMLAEVDETVRQLYYLTKALGRGFKSLVGRKKYGRVRLRDVPASVLQYNFGLAPLAGNVYDLVEIMRLKLEVPLYTKISGYAARYDSGTVSDDAGGFDWNAKRSQQWTMFVEFDTDEVSILRLGNPAEWLWERIPFSFAVDYVSTIGRWIGSLDALSAVKDVYGTVVTKDRFDYKRTRKSSPDVPWVCLKPGFMSYHSHRRDLKTSIPVPPLPTFHFPRGSWKRLLNISSVLAVMRSHPRYNYFADWFR